MSPIINATEKGIRLLDAFVKELDEALYIPIQPQETCKEPQRKTQLNTSDWIMVPAKYSTSEKTFYINPARLSKSQAVEGAASSLNLTINKTNKDTLDREYITNHTWYNFLRINRALGIESIGNDDFQIQTPNLSYTADAFKHIYRGIIKGRKVFTKEGKRVPRNNLKHFLHDWIKPGKWRAEWQDNRFTENNKKYTIHTNHTFDENGRISNHDSEELSIETLMEDRTPGTDLIDCFNKHRTTQGLPTKNAKEGKDYSWKPQDKKVAWLGADSGGAFLDCDASPSHTDSGLGVRSMLARI